MSSLERFQKLLRELFQLDLADLDFGLYRLFHLKRAEIEAFITEQLPREVDEAFAEVSAEERKRLEEELESLKTQIKEQISEDAILPTGEIKPEYRQSDIRVVRELVEKYEHARTQLEKMRITEGHKEVFNHLVNFFSRYYEDGDFIPKRRYGARETYAVPYNGEEVFFYWATKGMHYVKTHERFRDYAFKLSNMAGEYRVRFTLIEASIPKDNTKGNRRYFFPRPDLAAYNEKAREFVLPFEYRLPTPEEAERYGTNSKAQEAILEEALPRILEAVPDVNLRALLQQDQRTEKDIADDKPELPLLLKRLRHFCKRNTSDYFIHKDLRGFLQRELEFYIKDQVLHLMDLEADLEAKRRVIRTFKRLAEKIINFLASIEDVQRILFEKKKFILETDYLIPIQHIPREFWPEILRNEAQVAEWQRWEMLKSDEDLFNPDGEVNEAFLEAHPTLPVHTKHFDREFVRRLLEALPFDDLDEATDGLLVHGENYQALNLLLERYRDQVKCIYIDPPYNRETRKDDDFPYKDRYKHSSWIAMVEERLRIASDFLMRNGVCFIHIDENEQQNLKKMLDLIFLPQNRIEELIWAQNTTHSQSPLYSTNHEYIEVYAKDKTVLKQSPGMFREPKPGYAELMALVEELNPKYLPIEEVERRIKELFERHIEEYKAELKAMGLEYNEETKKQDPWRGIYNYCHAEYRDASGRIITNEKDASRLGAKLLIWRESDPSAPAQKQAESTKDPKDPNYRFYQPIHPKTGKPVAIPKRGWAWPYDWPDDSRDSFVKLDKEGRIVWGEDETKIPQYKRFLHEVETNIAKSFFFDYTDGEKQLAALFGKTGIFPTPKPTTIAQRFAHQVCSSTDIMLDFFAGSGTTGHAVINLNREDGGQRKFILVEMAEYFDTVLLPRIAKVMFAPEWKEGKPTRLPTPEEVERTPRLVKILQIESYEDALHNLAATAERMVRDETAREREEAYRELASEEVYRLRYWIELPLREAETCLRALDLRHPFKYTLEVLTDNGPVRKPVDLVETFNYLYGLRVKRYETWVSPEDGREYRVVKATDREGKRRVLVLWRDMEGLDPESERAFLEEKLAEMESGGEVWDEVLINGDAPIPGVASLDPLFKRLMLRGEAT